jgi:hypothetical protein
MSPSQDVQSAIAAAERVLPGECAPEGEEDERWQHLIKIGYFVESDPEAVWLFVLKWGSHEDEDLRGGVATVLLEHLLEYHFNLIFPRVEVAAKQNSLFADTFKSCWKLGQAEEPSRAERWEQLKASL